MQAGFVFCLADVASSPAAAFIHGGNWPIEDWGSTA
jgi:hypothetical protein